MKISIIGVGTFGSAWSKYLSKIGHEVIHETALGSDIIIVSTPSFAVCEALLKEKENIKDQDIIVCSKGFASDEKLLSDELEENFGNNIFFLYGPTIASGFNNGELSAMVLAGKTDKTEIKKNFESDKLRIELSDDIIGVQVGAALKNVVTIFVGIAEGSGYGENTQALVFTRGLEEIEKIGRTLGGKTRTFLGLTCAGDLTLRSRNRILGVEIGKGRNIEDITEDMGYIPEGLNALKNIKGTLKKLNMDSVFIDNLYDIVFENKSPKEIIDNMY